MGSKARLAIPAIAGLSLALGACEQAGDVLSTSEYGLIGNWDLHTVLRTTIDGTQISYSYPSFWQSSDCAKTLSARLEVPEEGRAKLRVHDHYSCQGHAQNDILSDYEFETELIESGRRWYLYYLPDHEQSAQMNGDDDGDDGGNNGTDDGGNNGTDDGGPPPIPERELWYMCTVDGSELECEDMIIPLPERRKLIFSYEEDESL